MKYISVDQIPMMDRPIAVRHGISCFDPWHALSEAGKAEIGKHYGQIADLYCARMCSKFGVSWKEIIQSPILVIELAITENLMKNSIQNGKPTRKVRKKQYNGTGGGEG